MKDTFIVVMVTLLSIDFAMRCRERDTDLLALLVNGVMVVAGVAAFLGV